MTTKYLHWQTNKCLKKHSLIKNVLMSSVNLNVICYSNRPVVYGAFSFHSYRQISILTLSLTLTLTTSLTHSWPVVGNRWTEIRRNERTNVRGGQWGACPNADHGWAECRLGAMPTGRNAEYSHYERPYPLQSKVIIRCYSYEFAFMSERPPCPFDLILK